jgi:hypothetical protein
MTIQCAFTYHPQLDRLFGGDMVRSLQGVRVKVFLMSFKRGEALYPLMNELAETYSQTVPADWQQEPPFPKPLAVLQRFEIPVLIDGQEEVVSMQDVFRLGLLPFLPEEYRELAQVVTVPYEPFAAAGTLQDTALLDASALVTFAARLFTILRCGHALDLVFSHSVGTCVNSRFVTPKGSIADLYYLTRLESAGVEIQRTQEQDLARGFRLLKRANASGADTLETAFVAAVTAYGGAETIAADLHEVLTKTVRRVIDLGQDTDALATLQPLVNLTRYARARS